MAAREEMSEFVRQQNPDQRERKRNSGEQQSRVDQSFPRGCKRIFHSREGRAILREGIGKLTANRESRNQRENKKNKRENEFSFLRRRNPRRVHPKGVALVKQLDRLLPISVSVSTLHSTRVHARGDARHRRRNVRITIRNFSRTSGVQLSGVTLRSLVGRCRDGIILA